MTADPTPLLDLPNLAARCGVGRVLAKIESERPLGNFKSLGGIGAGLSALLRATGAGSVEAFRSMPRASVPSLMCASDGNHGLAVAAAAARAGTSARVYLPAHVPETRAARIVALGGSIVRVAGSYDDAVEEARAAAAAGAGLLIADTTDEPDDPVVADVMAGYGIIAAEICAEIEAGRAPRPTHLYVQAGVGGLAAALADGLAPAMASPKRIVVVEPNAAACVGHALRQGRVETIAGDLATSADMLACGRASTPALRALLRHGAVGVAIGESELSAAPAILRDAGGPITTPSGAAGLAGLLAVASGDDRLAHGLGDRSTVVIIVTEGAAEPSPRS